VKFLVDMPLPPALARWLAAQAHDAVHADAMGLGRLTDREILTRARSVELADKKALRRGFAKAILYLAAPFDELAIT
jgi:hypothetical protein